MASVGRVRAGSTVGTSERLARTVVGVLVPLGLVLAGTLPVLIGWDRLPDPLAGHWGTDGRPDGTMAPEVLLGVTLAGTAVPGVVALIVARRRPAYRLDVFPAIGVATFVAAVVAFVAIATVVANLDAPTWTDAGGVGLAQVGLVFGGALAVAGASAWIAATVEQPRPAAQTVGVRPEAGPGPGAHTHWVGTARAPWAWMLAGSLAVIGLVVAVLVQLLIGVGLLVISLAGLPFTSVRVSVDDRGLRIEYGVLGRPVTRIPLDMIVEARCVDLKPAQWGGWGYRGSRRLLRRAAVVIRAGDALVVELEGGVQLAVTVDGACAGAGVCNELLARTPGR